MPQVAGEPATAAGPGLVPQRGLPTWRVSGLRLYGQPQRVPGPEPEREPPLRPHPPVV